MLLAKQSHLINRKPALVEDLGQSGRDDNRLIISAWISAYFSGGRR